MLRQLTRKPAIAVAVGTMLAVMPPAQAERIENQVAVFSALDKVTARISRLEVPLNQTVQFGTLKVTPRVCYSRPPTEPPKTTTFVEVEEVQLDGEQRRVFGGWMFAESPGLHAVEHPVFDVWLTGCTSPRPARGGPATAGTPGSGASSPATGDDLGERRRRVRQ